MTFSSGGTESDFDTIKASLVYLFGVDTSEIALSVKSTSASQKEIGVTIKATTENDAKRVIKIIDTDSFVNSVNDELNEIDAFNEAVLNSTSDTTCEGLYGSVTCGRTCGCSK